jgi:hypothetical protein
MQLVVLDDVTEREIGFRAENLADRSCHLG